MIDFLDHNNQGWMQCNDLSQLYNHDMTHATHSYSFSDETVCSAVHGACHFLNMPDIGIKSYHTTEVETHDPNTFADDVMGINIEQLLKHGINDADSLSLIATHEMAHSMLQNLSVQLNFTPWQEELTCDSIMGVRAAMEGIDLSKVEASMSHDPASSLHPGDELRKKYIEYGKEIGEELKRNHLPFTTDNILARLNEKMEDDNICKQEVLQSEHFEKTSFSGSPHKGIYSDADYLKNDAEKKAHQADLHANEARKDAERDAENARKQAKLAEEQYHKYKDELKLAEEHRKKDKDKIG